MLKKRKEHKVPIIKTKNDSAELTRFNTWAAYAV